MGNKHSAKPPVKGKEGENGQAAGAEAAELDRMLRAARKTCRLRGYPVSDPEFGSAVDAVEAAVEIQRKLAAGNRELPEQRRMQFRIGVNLGDVIVDLIVGTPKNAKTFRIHQKLLCAKIPYFDKMFKGEWKESKEHRASFPEDQPVSFEIMLEWVYFGNLR